MKKYIYTHKTLSTVIVLIILIGGFYTYKKIFPTVTIPQYVISPAHKGKLTQTVTGTGQVSAENQLDVTSQVSGQIISIPVSVGQSVHAGDILAKIDSSDALVALQNAQIAYAKLTEPAKPMDIQNAQDNLTKSYSDAYSAVSTAFIHVPTLMTGLKDLFYDKSGFLNDQATTLFIQTGRDYRNIAGATYDTASNEYNTILLEYQSLSKTSATSSLQTVMNDTYSFMQQITEAIKEAQTAITYISTTQPNYNTSGASSALSNLSTWSSQANSDLSSILSAKNTIESNRTTLQNLIIGADVLDIQAQKLSLQQQETNYAKYTIRAPFDGIVGRIPVNMYTQAGASTVIATIIGTQKLAVISLNEVDAAKVSVGQPVTITFDAIDGLNATGTVQEVDQVGTVSQGVVSYGVKILINTTDPRIKPGMSVNTTIITREKDGVLIVPTSAIKTSGKTSYVQVLTPSMASSTRQYSGMRNPNIASSTDSTATSTQRRNYSGTGGGNFGTGITISSATPPQKVNVSIGDSDDTNTEIVSGLNPGQFVVTRTITTSATTATTATPNILGTLGGGRGVSGGGTRVATPAVTGR